MSTKADMERWIEDIQTFQRIAGVAVSSRKLLESEWQKIRPGWRKRAIEGARGHRIIQDMAVNDGKKRKN